MANSGGSVNSTTPGGVSGTHAPFEGEPASVAPSTGSEKNVVSTFLVPLACWRVEDMRFKFDSSFVLPAIAAEIPLLSGLRQTHTLRLPGAPPGGEVMVPPPISLFGHADPVGSDDYNKQLSGRRATAIYGLLTRKADLWEKLYSKSFGGDVWGDDSLRTMLVATDSTLSADADRLTQRVGQARADAGQRQTLFQNYMNKVAGSFVLVPSDFLGAGADSKGKADYQGCGEFNPVMIFSQEDLKKYQDSKLKEERDAKNGPNRRVMALLFRPGTVVDPKKWPCPRAEEPVAGCIHRFWSDGEKRRSTHLSGITRKFEETHDTFGCRFYHRLAGSSPCEKILPRVPALLEVILDNDNNQIVDASEPVATFVRVGLWDHAFDRTTGVLINQTADAKNFVSLDSVGKEARRFYFRVTDTNAAGQAEVRVQWRTELGAGGNDDAPASQDISLLPTGDPSVFVSKAVFLVVDTDDQQQATESGLPAGNPDVGPRNNGQSNHRTRKFLVDATHQLDTNLVAEYTSVLGGGTVKSTVPMFNRSPEERLRIKVHLVSVRNTVGGSGTMSAGQITAESDTIRKVYACTGIFCDVDSFEIDPPASCIGWAARVGGALAADPSVEDMINPPFGPSPSQLDIVKVVQKRPDFGANDIYLVYVQHLYATASLHAATPSLSIANFGISFPDVFVPSSIARGFGFIGLTDATKYVAVHEMTHMTTNLKNSEGGHFHMGAANVGSGNFDFKNLMCKSVSANPNGVGASKRLWDENFTNANVNPSTLPAQVTAIRGSRFVAKF